MYQRKQAAPRQRTRSKQSWQLPFTDAPLFHALQVRAAGDSARFHMPGHKGEPVFNTYADIFAIDFTETYGTGNLYNETGPIRDAELAAANYYDAADCLFLTGGATQGIFAMLASAVGEGGSVLLDRECHQSVCHACALLGIRPYFISAPLVEPFGISGDLVLEQAWEIIAEQTDISAIMLTSPTYYGIRRSINKFSALCRRYNKLLLVDAAHGAHFPAVGITTPIAEGADMAVMSVHKTLPAMGQGAVLLCGKDIDRHTLRENTELFGTSSPSYPIMASIDLARAYMEGPGRAAYRHAAINGDLMRRYIGTHTKFGTLCESHYPEIDPCRLTVCTAGTKLSGYALADLLWHKYGVACEMADARNVVFILSGLDSTGALHRLRRGLRSISKVCRERELPPASPVFPSAVQVMSVRRSWFSPTRRIALENAENLICARPITPYPPGVPLLWPGEKITAEHIELIHERWYNEIKYVTVVS